MSRLTGDLMAWTRCALCRIQVDYQKRSEFTVMRCGSLGKVSQSYIVCDHCRDHLQRIISTNVEKAAAI